MGKEISTEYFSNATVGAFKHFKEITEYATNFIVTEQGFWEILVDNKKDLNAKLGLNKENDHRKKIVIPNVIHDKIKWLNDFCPDWRDQINEIMTEDVIVAMLSPEDGGSRLITAGMKEAFASLGIPDELGRIPRVGSKTSTLLRKFISTEHDFIFNAIVDMMNKSWVIGTDEEWTISTNPVDFLLMGVGYGFCSCLHPASEHYQYKGGVYWHMSSPETFIVIKTPVDLEQKTGTEKIDIEERFLVHDFNGAFALGRYYGGKYIPPMTHFVMAELLGYKENLSRVSDVVKYWRVNSSYTIYVNDSITMYYTFSEAKGSTKQKFRNYPLNVTRKCSTCGERWHVDELANCEDECCPECEY